MKTRRIKYVWEYADGHYEMLGSRLRHQFYELPVELQAAVALLKPLPSDIEVPGVGESTESALPGATRLFKLFLCFMEEVL
jgi:hypothetical protein